ncbi:hypothetical protein MCOR08_006363 [Pyricularia oryzae]|nr:hypothetical protein MCOR01_008625 [Pyricularia oryzae]KAI6629741.1 hypothetical protein MCOR08_006363 [Pyricularia oryzae]
MSDSSSDDSSTSSTTTTSASTRPARHKGQPNRGSSWNSSKNQAPQERLDDFWDKFTTKTPGKAMRILPRKDYTPKKQKERPGESVQLKPVSYDEAVAQCKAKVAQVVKECRRVNQRYRDPHFDLEIDFQLRRNQCLVSLSNRRRDIMAMRATNRKDGAVHGVETQSRAGLAQAKASSYGQGGPRPRPPPSHQQNFRPMAVHRVTEIFEKPQFFVDGPSANDVRQGREVGDCWLMAALCTMSNKPGLIERICIAHDVQVGVYGFVFHRDGDWFSEIIDDKLYLTKGDYDDGCIERILLDHDRVRQDSEEAYRRLYQTNSGALYFAQSSEPNETWVSLLEKAYAKAHGDYEAIEGGFTGEGIEDLTGGITQEIYATDILDKEHFWKEGLLRVNKDFLFGCSTGIWGRGTGERRGIVELHAYSVMKTVEIGGHRLLMLRNPWGRDEWKGKWSDGSAEWTPEWLAKLNHRFGDDGAFWISYEDLLRKFQSFDRTRLFGPEWKAAAIWTTFSVPWVHEYHDTKFAFSLSRPGPVVLVLSQLDKRYFKGLEGQYRFEFSFRVHVSGQEDYLVRSPTPYRMNRSVNVELDLEAGDYTVLVMVNASRDTSSMPAEDVAKAYSKNQREKLARIALSYDLAHSRGRIVETAQEKEARIAAEVRKKEKAKRKLKKAIMEDRHLRYRIDVREVLTAKKAKAKAKAKRARKRAEEEKKWKEEAEKANEALKQAQATSAGGQSATQPQTQADAEHAKGDKTMPAVGSRAPISQVDADYNNNNKAPIATLGGDKKDGSEQPSMATSSQATQGLNAPNVTSATTKGSLDIPTPVSSLAESVEAAPAVADSEPQTGEVQCSGEASNMTAHSLENAAVPVEETPELMASSGVAPGNGEHYISQDPNKTTGSNISNPVGDTPRRVISSTAVETAECGTNTEPKQIVQGLHTADESVNWSNGIASEPVAAGPNNVLDSQHTDRALLHPDGTEGTIPRRQSSRSRTRGQPATFQQMGQQRQLQMMYRGGVPPYNAGRVPARGYGRPQRFIPRPGRPDTEGSVEDSSETESVSGVSEISDGEIELELDAIHRGWRQYPAATGVFPRTSAVGPPARPSLPTGPSPDGEVQKDPWNAVVILGLRVYYRLAQGEGADTEVVKLRIERPDPYATDDQDSDEEDVGAARKAKAGEQKVMDVDNSAKDAAKDIDIVDNGVVKANDQAPASNVPETGKDIQGAETGNIKTE